MNGSRTVSPGSVNNLIEHQEGVFVMGIKPHCDSYWKIPLPLEDVISIDFIDRAHPVRDPFPEDRFPLCDSSLIMSVSLRLANLCSKWTIPLQLRHHHRVLDTCPDLPLPLLNWSPVVPSCP